MDTCDNSVIALRQPNFTFQEQKITMNNYWLSSKKYWEQKYMTLKYKPTLAKDYYLQLKYF